MKRGLKEDVGSEAAPLVGAGEVGDHRGGSQRGALGGSSLPQAPACAPTLLRVGAQESGRFAGEAECFEEVDALEWSDANAGRGGGGEYAVEGGDRGDRSGESAVKKGALAVEAKRHKGTESRAQILEVVRLAKERGLSTSASLKALAISKASYYRYRSSPVLNKRRGRKRQALPTPQERATVIQTALDHPLMGYKRLTFLVQNEEKAGLRAHQVRSILSQEGLLGPRAVPMAASLKKPPLPERPNELWHIDLMYLRVNRRWFYLVDIIDGYSRYVVHWTLNPTMETRTVSQTVQEALERWRLLKKAPAIVHDSGTQFVSKDWREFVSFHEILSIRTRIAHPESNGLIERLHRTHRAEALGSTEEWSLEQALQVMGDWVDVYNGLRPHHALRGLPPVVYYLGDPEAAFAQREHFVQAAAEARTNYWRQEELTISS
jgi:putative transposase